MRWNVSIVNNVLKLSTKDGDKVGMFKPESVMKVYYLDCNELKIITRDNEKVVIEKDENDEPEDFEEFCHTVLNWFQNTSSTKL